MIPEHVQSLTTTLRRYGQVPAVNKETGELILTTNRANPNFTYIALEDYVAKLEADGQTIDPFTLQIVRLAPSKKQTKKEPEELPKETLAIPAWTKEELDALPWDKLRKLAKKYDDVKGNKGRDVITKQLIGKPKP